MFSSDLRFAELGTYFGTWIATTCSGRASRFTLIAAREVVLDPRTRAAPGSVGRLRGSQPPPRSRHAERVGRDPLGSERRQRHQTRRSGDRGHDKLVEVVEDRPGQQLAKRAVVTLIRTLKSRQVACAVSL